ncbi:sulfatase family protein [Kiritimatiella glycovorans]|uniref:Arylsulfatase n=1 Tax=Kiritimatiella glycovorans TaxID=1307763 RepID=A0A0G3EAX3_9BACT|nr:arylsulfatase [Kiritimatiella glycovorans]AKJ63641.1 Arylsulfatase [Kiritimatiella glycovorans]
MKRRDFLESMGAGTIGLSASRGLAMKAGHRAPNVIVILTDDLGYGDLGCYGNRRVPTPSLDRLASEGILFTDGYAPAAICTPTRYAMLTGRYPWRTWLKKGVVGEAPSLIDPARYTLPKMFRDAGYATGCIGKWHIGLGTEEDKRDIDWNHPPIEPNPNTHGFDYSFILPVGHFFPPYVYMENDHVWNHDPDDPIRVVWPERGKPTMEGGEQARYRQEDVTRDLVERVERFIDDHRRDPFFLYFATSKPHSPHIAHEDFQGRSRAGAYGDVLMELDWSVGEVIRHLEQRGLRENTLIVFASDNGGVGRMHGDLRDENYNPNTPLRGNKGDCLEGGVRVPFLVSWPARIAGGGRSSSVVCLTDLMASFATLLGRTLPEGAAPDSYDVLPALMDAGVQAPERPLVLQGRSGVLALRYDRHLYIGDPGNGDWDRSAERMPAADLKAQLYDLSLDRKEDFNLYDDLPGRASEMADILERLRSEDSLTVWSELGL